MMERVVVAPTKDGPLRIELHGFVPPPITADEPIGAATKAVRAASGEAARLSVVAGARYLLCRNRRRLVRTRLGSPAA